MKYVGDILYLCFEDIGVGTSVTNASEIIATDIVSKHNLNPTKCKFFETYPYSDEFDEIIYKWDNNVAMSAKWKPCNPEDLLVLNEIKTQDF